MQIAANRLQLTRHAAQGATPSPRSLALSIARAWLVLGCLAVLSVPALRGRNEVIGWLPFWFVLMPAAQCLILRWREVLVTSRTTFARLRAHGRGRTSRRVRHNRRETTRRPSIWSVAFLMQR